MPESVRMDMGGPMSLLRNRFEKWALCEIQRHEKVFINPLWVFVEYTLVLKDVVILSMVYSTDSSIFTNRLELTISKEKNKHLYDAAVACNKSSALHFFCTKKPLAQIFNVLTGECPF